MPMSFSRIAKEEYKRSKDAIEAEYKSARALRLAGEAMPRTSAGEAKGNRKAASRPGCARQEHQQAWREAREARAEADYGVAKEKCDDLGGNAKDVCLKEAKAARTAAMADAKVDRKARDARGDTNKAVSQARARRPSASPRRERTPPRINAADYAVARERCDKFAGDVKARCLDELRRNTANDNRYQNAWSLTLPGSGQPLAAG